MKCRVVRTILSSNDESEFAMEMESEVSLHLAGCEECSRYKAKMNAVTSALRQDVCHIANAELSSRFSVMLTARLVNEQNLREESPIGRIERYFGLSGGNVCAWERLVARGMTIGIGLCAAFGLAIAIITSPASRSATAIEPSHIAAIGVSSDRKGLLCAQVTSATAAPRSVIKETLR